MRKITIPKTTAPVKAPCRSKTLFWRKYFSVMNIIKYTTDAIEAVKKGLTRYASFEV